MRFDGAVGHYRNQKQAFSNPASWPQIDIRIENKHNIMTVKSWYKYKGESDPYNHIQYDWQQLDENIVYTKTTNLITNRPSCPFIWQYDGVWWNGCTDGECLQGNTRIESTIRFNGVDYRAKDVGYDITTGKQVYGKDPADGEFLFVLIDK